MMFFTNYFTLLIPPIKCLVVLVGELDAINLTMTTRNINITSSLKVV